MENCNAKAILAFDCATPHASVALKTSHGCEQTPISKSQHAAELVPAIHALMAAHNINYSALSAIVTTTGPGSFTGLRIALATAHGLHLACNAPLKCTTSLAAIAHRAPHPSLRAIMAVGKGEVAYQDFTSGTASGDIIRANEQDAELFNTSAALMGTIQHPDVDYISGIDATWLCDMAPALPITPLADATPLYIRPPDAIIPQAPRWLAS